jgi:hypothetical protein
MCAGQDSPSTKLLPPQKFVWAPARGLAYWLGIAPPFESRPHGVQTPCSGKTQKAGQKSDFLRLVRRAGFEPAQTEVAWFTAKCD